VGFGFSKEPPQAEQPAEKVSEGSVFVVQPLLAVCFSDLSRIRETINRENRTAKSGCATFSAFCLAAGFLGVEVPHGFFSLWGLGLARNLHRLNSLRKKSARDRFS
jgi:hypothetical protein